MTLQVCECICQELEVNVSQTLVIKNIIFNNMDLMLLVLALFKWNNYYISVVLLACSDNRHTDRTE